MIMPLISLTHVSCLSSQNTCLGLCIQSFLSFFLGLLDLDLEPESGLFEMPGSAASDLLLRGREWPPNKGIWLHGKALFMTRARTLKGESEYVKGDHDKHNIP